MPREGWNSVFSSFWLPAKSCRSVGTNSPNFIESFEVGCFRSIFSVSSIPPRTDLWIGRLNLFNWTINWLIYRPNQFIWFTCRKSRKCSICSFFDLYRFPTQEAPLQSGRGRWYRTRRVGGGWMHNHRREGVLSCCIFLPLPYWWFCSRCKWTSPSLCFFLR